MPRTPSFGRRVAVPNVWIDHAAAFVVRVASKSASASGLRGELDDEEDSLLLFCVSSSSNSLQLFISSSIFDRRFCSSWRACIKRPFALMTATAYLWAWLLAAVRRFIGRTANDYDTNVQHANGVIDRTRKTVRRAATDAVEFRIGRDEHVDNDCLNSEDRRQSETNHQKPSSQTRGDGDITTEVCGTDQICNSSRRGIIRDGLRACNALVKDREISDARCVTRNCDLERCTRENESEVEAHSVGNILGRCDNRRHVEHKQYLTEE